MILIIDDDIAVQTSLSLLLKQSGYTSLSASGPKEAIDRLNNNSFDLILLDMNFSVNTTGEEGLNLLNEIKSRLPRIPVILITAWGSIELAVEGMKRGASDFINKPWKNENVIESIKTILDLTYGEHAPGKEKLNRSALAAKYQLSNIVGEDSEMVKILETVGRVGRTDASVLITGESGTGKELIAEAIHNNSKRSGNAFVKVNLGGISSSLFESEMFGHVRGAFTDAHENRIGRFEAANGGTIFLDEIGDLDPGSQVKLLRVLQDRSFEVLGSSKTKTIDTRVIAATNRNLSAMIEKGDFREDLFYRINLIPIHIPPLRKRRGDIPLLINYFLINLKTIYERPELKISASAVEWMTGLQWHGNIRELKNLVERTVVVSNHNIIEKEDLVEQQQAFTKKKPGSLPDVGEMSLEEIEISMIKKALSYHNNNINKAAESLGLSRYSLYRRMEKFRINI
jgi:DNA-binding NtrC family response regulator